MEINQNQVEKTSRRCTVKHSPICKFLGSDGCEKCSLYKGDVKEIEKVKTGEIWAVTQSNLPWDADDFHESETCMFCKDRPGNPKVAYGTVELAHPEPAYEKRMLFGLGKTVREDVGSLIPFPVAMCKDCKKRYNMVENLKFYSATVGFLVGVLIVLLIADWEVIAYSPEYIPIVIVLFFMAVIYVLGGKLADRLIKKYSDKMYFRLFEIPEMAEMEEMGWFVYREEKEKTRLVISKKKPREKFRFFSLDPRQPGDE